MAVGTPVIASRTGGLQEIVEPEKNGLLVEPEDPAALAGAIVRLLDDPVLSARLAEDGKRRATVDFSQERMLSRLVEVYRGLGGERTRLALGSLEP
jgi:glycosyltransferase involved in cell wall biosynthesis